MYFQQREAGNTYWDLLREIDSETCKVTGVRSLTGGPVAQIQLSHCVTTQGTGVNHA